MSIEEDNSWIFDSLVCFLNGPIWDAPLQSFIEEKSLIFELNDEDNEEYRKIFDEFKNLVDFMLGNFMEDLGITPEQFEEACQRGKQKAFQFDYNLFEQIWAANDYNMFKRMMTQRNVELQLEALELIEEKYGITPQSFIPKKKDEQEENVKETPVTIETSSRKEKEILSEVAKEYSVEKSTSKEVEYILEGKDLLETTLKSEKEKLLKESPLILQGSSPLASSVSKLYKNGDEQSKIDASAEKKDTSHEGSQKTNSSDKKLQATSSTDIKPGATNEEPQTTNEEPQTTNEEPQATNKDPQTTNKEPQTTNKELQTTNKEPQITNKAPQATSSTNKQSVTSSIEKEPKSNTSDVILHNIRPEIDSVEMKKRQEYLRAQRDKLVALKKEVRKKHLENEKENGEKKRSRPKSARAAEAVLAGSNSKIETQQLQIRKALAERLKAEVVNKEK